MKVNIDLHILKKISALQRKIDREVILADKHWKSILGHYSELKALTEFVEGEGIEEKEKEENNGRIGESSS